MTPSFPLAGNTPPMGSFGALEMGPLVNIDQDTHFRWEETAAARNHL